MRLDPSPAFAGEGARRADGGSLAGNRPRTPQPPPRGGQHPSPEVMHAPLPLRGYRGRLFRRGAKAMQAMRWMVATALLCGSAVSAGAFAAAAQQDKAPAGSAIGVDLAGMDHSVKPGDDFDNFA